MTTQFFRIEICLVLLSTPVTATSFLYDRPGRAIAIRDSGVRLASTISAGRLIASFLSGRISNAQPRVFYGFPLKAFRDLSQPLK